MLYSCSLSPMNCCKFVQPQMLDFLETCYSTSPHARGAWRFAVHRHEISELKEDSTICNNHCNNSRTWTAMLMCKLLLIGH